MPRRRRSKSDRDIDRIEYAIKAGLGLLMLLALASGGMVGFGERLIALIYVVFLLAISVAAIAGIIFVIRRTDWSASHALTKTGTQYERPYHPSHRTASDNFPKTSTPANWCQEAPPFVWTIAEIKKHLNEIDWYQFEKFCAAILKAEGYQVQRSGGASPDGGVDLVAQKNQTRTLIQCKHWKTWKIREPIIRQLLGSMVDFKVDKGAVFFSGESTEPAKDFAAKHGISLVSGEALAERALKALSTETLDRILKCEDHHCPKCDSLMVWRTGDFKPFWGCSKFPRCRGVLKHSGAR